jgi:hypothetical protein
VQYFWGGSYKCSQRCAQNARSCYLAPDIRNSNQAFLFQGTLLGRHWCTYRLKRRSILYPLGIHQGGIHIGEKQSPDDKDTLGVKIVRMAHKFALEHNLPSFLILDAFFSKRKNCCISQFHMVNRFKTAFTNTNCQGKKELCSIF